MVTRDALGKKIYRMGKFTVGHIATGWNIFVHDSWSKCNAITDTWFPIEPFDSFAKAVRYLKRNYEHLM